MALNDSSAPTPITPDSAATPATPVIPGTGALAQPGPGVNAAPVTTAPAAAPAAAPASPDEAQAQTNLQTAQTNYKQAADLANTSSTLPPVKHARLLAMVSGLAQGLSAAGAALSSGGKEGGAAQVQQMQQAAQDQRIKQQQAATEQKNAEINQKMMVGDTAMKLSQSWLSLASVHHQLTQDDLTEQRTRQDIQSGALGLNKDAYDQMISGALPWSKYQAIANGTSAPPAAGGSGAAPAGAGTPASTSTPVPGAPSANGIPSQAVMQWNKPIVEAQTSPYKDDPVIQKAAADFETARALQDPNQAQTGMLQASNIAASHLDALEKGTAARKAESDADLAATNATAGKIKAAQDQIAQNTYNRTVGKNNAGQPTEDFATWQARATKLAEVAAEQGDPTTMGAMAADGLLTISQIALARNLDKTGFQKLLAGADAEAKRIGTPEIVINGKPTGHYFNANAATQQYQYVTEFNNPNGKIQQSIQSGNTFINHAADLHDLAKNYSNTNAKILNTPLNKIKDAFGDAEYTRINAAIEPVITEYNNALSAGFSPDASAADAARTILSTSSNLGQVDAATQQMAHTLLRRMDSTDQGYATHTGQHYPNMITPDAAVSLGKLGLDAGHMQSGGTFGGPAQTVNQGTTSAAPAGSPASKVHANLSDFTHTVSAAKGTIYSDDGRTWYDAKGNLISGK